MKILHVTPTYIPAYRYGGPIYSVHSLCKSLVENGHEVHVYTTNVDGSKNSDVPLDRNVDIDGVRIRYFPSRWLRRLYWSPNMWSELKQRITEFDIIHLHSIFLCPTLYAARCAKNANIPYIISPRGMLVKELFRRKRFWFKSLWLILFESKSIKNASAIHVTSRLEENELKKFNLSFPDIFNISNGVELPSKKKSTLAVSADVSKIIELKNYALYLGRISWKKGLDDLIRNWSKISNTILVIAGNDEEGYVRFLTELIDINKLASKVVVLSRNISGSDKEALYKSCKFFILPSYSENFGNTVLEAMIRGVPVITTDSVGAGDIVQQSGAGLVVKRDELSNAIRNVLNDSATATNMGRNGKQYVMQHLQWTTIAVEMASQYKRLLVSQL